MPTKAESCVPICVTLDHCREQRAALPLQAIAAAEAAKRNESATLKSILTGKFNKNGWRITRYNKEIGPFYIIGPATLLLVRRDFPKRPSGPPNQASEMVLYLSATPRTMIVVQKVMMVIPLSHGSFLCSERLSNRFQFTLKCDLAGWLSLASSFVEIRINKQSKGTGEHFNRSHRLMIC